MSQMWSCDSTYMTCDNPQYSCDGKCPPPTNEQYIQYIWPNFWAFDHTTTFTFDSTDTQFAFDGGAGGTGGTSQATGPLSKTRTENLYF